MADETVLTLEEQEKLAADQAAKQREGISGFEQPAPVEDAKIDPRKARRDELLAQLEALDYNPTAAKDMSDKELFISFHDALVLALGSHPSLDGLWSEMKARALKA